MGFDLQDTIAKWAALEKTDKGVPSQAFLDASLAITNIFDELSGMSSVKSDIEGNLAKIQKNVTDPLKELEEMIEADIAGCGGDLKKATKEGSTGLALLWLKRALMMISGLIAAMIEKPDADLKSCVQEGYEFGLKRHHNMIMKGVFAARHTSSNRLGSHTAASLLPPARRRRAK